MARTLELDTLDHPGITGTANIVLSSDGTTTMPLVDINGGTATLATVDINGGTIDGVTVAATTGTFTTVGIGTTSPNANAVLDLSSTTKAFILPRMTTAQRNAISSPVAGMVIYNTESNEINFYTGSAWGLIEDHA